MSPGCTALGGSGAGGSLVISILCGNIDLYCSKSSNILFAILSDLGSPVSSNLLITMSIIWSFWIIKL